MGWRTIFRSRRKENHSFNEYELRVLEEILAVCAPDYRLQLQEQILSAPKLLRLDDGLEVRVPVEHFKDHDPKLTQRLPLDAHEHELAEVRVHGDVLASNMVKVKLRNGYLHCLDFQSDARHAQLRSVNALTVNLNPIFAPDNLRTKSEPVAIAGEIFYLPKEKLPPG